MWNSFHYRCCSIEGLLHSLENNMVTMVWRSLEAFCIKLMPPIHVNTRTNCFSFTDIRVSGTEHVERGSPIQLVCNATGWLDAPHNVDWYKDGNKVHSDVEKGVIITKKIDANMLVSVLVIRFSKMSDAGVYLCRSSNRHIAKLTIHILNGNLVTYIFLYII